MVISLIQGKSNIQIPKISNPEINYQIPHDPTDCVIELGVEELASDVPKLLIEQLTKQLEDTLKSERLTYDKNKMYMQLQEESYQLLKS